MSDGLGRYENCATRAVVSDVGVSDILPRSLGVFRYSPAERVEGEALIALAVQFGGARLIDNIRIEDGNVTMMLKE